MIKQYRCAPNQSLKLTETAVSFSPRAKKFLREWRRLPRV
jgi:hypothetical protein